MLRLALGASIIAFAPIMVKLASMGPTGVGFYRVFFAALAFGALARGRFVLTPLVVGAGFFFALDLYFWHRSILYIGAGVGTILANTQALFLPLVTWFIFKEKPHSLFWLPVLVALSGIYLMIFGFSYILDVPSDSRLMKGFLYGAGTGFVYALFLCFLRISEKREGEIPLVRRLGGASLVTAVLLLLVWIPEGDVALPIGIDWLWLIILGIGVHVGGWIVITGALKNVRPTQAGLLLLVQPVLATFLGALLFNEVLRWEQDLGAMVTLSAIYAGSLLKSEKV